MTTANDLADLLVAAGIGTKYTNIFPDSPMPLSPDVCISITPSGGKTAPNHCDLERPVYMVAVRGVASSGVAKMCDDIRDALLKNGSGSRRHDETINGTYYLSIEDHGGGWNIYQPPDDSERIYRSRTFYIVKRF
jgi:hypothetical protein